MVFARMICGLLTGLGCIYGGMILEGGHFSSTVQLTAFLLVFGGTFGVLVMVYPPRYHMKSYFLALTNATGTSSEVQIARSFFTTMGNAFVTMGIVGSLLGLIHVMENLDQPEMIGPGIAVAFVSLFYGFMGRLFLSGAMYDASGAKESQLTEILGANIGENSTTPPTPVDVSQMYTKIGQLVMELERKNNNKAA